MTNKDKKRKTSVHHNIGVYIDRHALSAWQLKINELINEYGRGAFLLIDENELNLSYIAPETDAEDELRIDKLIESERTLEEREKEYLKILQKKYPNIK